MCLNVNQSWWCVINVVNGILFENYHLVLYRVSSTLVFISSILISKVGIQRKTNFNIFVRKWRSWKNWTAVLWKDAISSSKIWCLLTGSSSRFHLRSHSLVYIKINLFTVRIGSILNKELEFIYQSDCSDRTCIYSEVSVVYNTLYIYKRNAKCIIFCI